MLTKAIEAVEDELAALKDRTAREIEEINGYLIRSGAKTKLRLFMKNNSRYSAFSIIWRKIIFMDWEKRRAKAKYIKKGRGYQVPKIRLMAHCKNSEDWEKEYIWQKEQEMALVRKKVDLLSTAILALRQYVDGDGKCRVEGAHQGG
jgi:hypothetical protein